MPDIQIHSLDGAHFTAYAAMPAGGNGPGLILIHEIFGLSPAMRLLCDYYAAQGYVTICPNLYARLDPDEEKTLSLKDNDWETAALYFKNFDPEAGVRDLLSTLATIRQTPGCAGKVGAVGYCLGSRLSFLMATRSDVECSVGYYGVGIDRLLDEVYDIRMPYMLHLAENDVLLPAVTQNKLIKSLKRNPVITVHTYNNAEHGFARHGGAKFNKKTNDLANERTLTFLKEHLSA